MVEEKQQRWMYYGGEEKEKERERERERKGPTEVAQQHGWGLHGNQARP